MNNSRGGPRLGRSMLAAVIGCFGTAIAQADTLVNTPAEKFAMAPGGVDMRTGHYVYNETDLSIGGDGALTFARTMPTGIAGHAMPFANLSHNWDIMILEMFVPPPDPNYSAGLVRQMTIHFGGRVQTYRLLGVDTQYTQVSTGGRAPLTFSGSASNLNDASVVYTYQAADGTVMTFRPIGGGDCSDTYRCAYVSQIVEADGTVYSFDYVSSGGSSGGNARLARIVSTRGYALLLEGSGHLVTKACVLNLAVTALPSAGSSCPADAPAASSYTYNGTAQLASATGPDNRTSQFTYAAAPPNGSIAMTAMGFIRPGETAPWLTNTFYIGQDEELTPQEIIYRQDFADGQNYTYSFVYGPAVGSNPPTIAGGSYTDALGHTTSVNYDWPIAPGANTPGSACTHLPCSPPPPDSDNSTIVYQQTSGPVQITDPLNRITNLDYCDPIPMQQLPSTEHNRCIVVPLVSFTDPEGIKTELQYDDHQNIIHVTRHAIPGSLQPNGQPWPDIVTSAVYDTTHPKSSSKPLSTTDANNNTTTYTYSTDHGGVLTESGPAVNGIHPQTRHEYAQRYAWLANGSGGYAQAATPIWVQTAISLCRTSAATGNPSAPCATAGDEVRTTYDYGPDSGPNTLLLRGRAVTSTDNGITTTLRTCYGYDALGRRISQTSPNANLASCP